MFLEILFQNYLNRGVQIKIVRVCSSTHWFTREFIMLGHMGIEVPVKSSF